MNMITNLALNMERKATVKTFIMVYVNVVVVQEMFFQAMFELNYFNIHEKKIEL